MEEESPEGPKRPSKKLRDFIRENSVKFGDVAESVVLPRNKRSVKVNPRRTLESQESVESKSLDPNKRHFPFFILLLALFQIGVMVFFKRWTWLSLCYDPFRRHELWRYFSVLFVHGSLSHLLGNLIFEIILGLLLESVHGWKRVSAIFLSGVAGGSLAVTVLDPMKYTVGASAGVYGFLTAHLVTILINWDQMERRILRLVCLLIYIVFDILTAVYSPETNVSHVGHFGGAIGGFVAATFILRNFEVLPWEKTFQKIVGACGVSFVLVIVIINVGFPSYYFPTEFNFEYLDTYLKYFAKLLVSDDRFTTARDECKMTPSCLETFRNANITLP